MHGEAERELHGMLDGVAKRAIDPALDALGARLWSAGVPANAVTIAACLLGLVAAGAIAAGWLWLGLALMLASRLGDGLDGAVARKAGPTDFGGLLDIVLDFVFYGAIPLGFILLDPAANAVAGAVLIFAFYVNGSSFLAFSLLAAKRGLRAEARGPKSIYFTTGLAEATETLVVFAAFCLFPGWFAAIAYVFATLTFYTALSRLVLAARTFR
jgi:phosphatidylglycerophosphate synthase